MAEKPAKSYFSCWFASDDQADEINRLRTELEETKMKLDWSRKELKRIRAANPSDPNVPADYNYATMIVHRETNQSSSLAKYQESVRQKQEQRRRPDDNDYVALSDEEDEEDENETSTGSKSKAEMKKTIDRLSLMVKEHEQQQNSMMQSNKRKDEIIKTKDAEIAELKKQIEEYNRTSSNSSRGKANSFSMSLNASIMEMEQSKHSKATHTNTVPVYDEDEEEDDESKSDSQTKTNGQQRTNGTKPKKTKKRVRNHYDNVEEQIEILNDSQLKQKSIALLAEKSRISKSASTDVGVVTFFTKYLNQKTVNQIFEKSGKAQQTDTNMILSASGLVNVLSFSVILYKVKVHQVLHGKERPQIDNADIKNTVKYLAIWIVRTYGSKAEDEEKYVDSESGREYDAYQFKLSKDKFGAKMSEYLQAFATQKGKHSDSRL